MSKKLKNTKTNSMPSIKISYSDYIISQYVAKNRKGMTAFLADIRK